MKGFVFEQIGKNYSPPTKEKYVSYGEIKNIDLDTIKWLVIHGKDIPELDTEKIFIMKNLRKISIYCLGKIDYSISKCILANKKIKVLEIRVNNCYIEIPNEINELNELEELYLDYNGKNKFSILSLSDLKKLKILKLINVGEVDLKGIHLLTDLERIELYLNSLKYTGKKDFCINNIEIKCLTSDILRFSNMKKVTLYHDITIKNQNIISSFGKEMDYFLLVLKAIISTNSLINLFIKEYNLNLEGCLSVLDLKNEQELNKYITEYLHSKFKKNTLNENTNIIIVGKIKHNITKLKQQLALYGIIVKRNFDTSIDYILLGNKPGNKKDIVVKYSNKIIFEDDILNFLEKKGTYYLKDNTNIDLGNIRDMIYSEDLSNMKLLNELLYIGGVPDEVKEDLIVAYLKMGSDGSSYSDDKDYDIIEKIRTILKNILIFSASEKLKDNLKKVKLTLYGNFDPASPYRVKEMIKNLCEDSELNLDKLNRMLMKLLIIERKIRLDSGELFSTVYEDLLEDYKLIENEIDKIYLKYKVKELPDTLFSFNKIKSLKVKYWKTNNPEERLNKLKELRSFEIEEGNEEKAIKNIKPFLPYLCALKVNGKNI